MDNFAATGVRIPDRPARSESLYRLRLQHWPRILYTNRNHTTYFLKHVLFLKNDAKIGKLKIYEVLEISTALSDACIRAFPRVQCSTIDSVTPAMHI
jgi:hypothetical protein